MSEPKPTATASLPADLYPTPPTSPLSAKVANRPAPGKAVKSPNFEPSIDLVASSASSLNQKEHVRPVTPVESEASDEDESEHEKESKLNEWTAALSLSEMKCGAVKQKTNEPCNNMISMKKKERMEDIIKLLWDPKISPQVAETHLDALAKLIHCHYHDHPPLREARVSEWLAVLPGGPRSPSLQKRLRNMLGSAPTKCTSNRRDGQPCGYSLKKEKRFYCDKTIKLMIRMAIEPDQDDEPIEVLAAVLQYHMLCHHHNARPYKQRDDWASRISDFRKACENEKKFQKQKEITAQNDIEHKPKPSSTEEGTLISPPSTRTRDETSKEPSTYWAYRDKKFETSRFDILGKGDMAEEDAISTEAICNIARELLNTDPKRPSENEVNDGYVYLYQVPGNDSLVKIGFTTRDVTTRHEEWKQSCHRVPTVHFPTAATCKAVPHARRLERLVHAELMEQRVRIYCERCEKQHIEWFEVSVAKGIEVIEKWSRWMEGRPYEKRKTRAVVKWYLKEIEVERLADVSKFLQELQEAVKQSATS
ncbi:hypothetical protein PWT90_01015 [Aphanocladium album]|nr:hypothetical protein PWT90_01015 [Aphanocladium album]